jgi:hypothetical protein
MFGNLFSVSLPLFDSIRSSCAAGKGSRGRTCGRSPARSPDQMDCGGDVFITRAPRLSAVRPTLAGRPPHQAMPRPVPRSCIGSAATRRDHRRPIARLLRPRPPRTGALSLLAYKNRPSTSPSRSFPTPPPPLFPSSDEPHHCNSPSSVSHYSVTCTGTITGPHSTSLTNLLLFSLPVQSCPR